MSDKNTGDWQDVLRAYQAQHWGAEASPAPPAAAMAAILAEAEQTREWGTKPALPWCEAQHMPALCWKTGEPVPPLALNYLLHCQRRTELVVLEARAAEIVALLDTTTSGEFALALWHGWLGQGAPAKESWLLPLIATLADARLVPRLGQQIERWVQEARGLLATRAVEALGLVEADAAFIELDDITARVQHSGVKRDAQRTVLERAKRLHLSREELADRLAPRLGFSEQGERVFDYGPRQFTVRFGLDRTLALSDSAGKRLTTLPKPGARDNAEQAAAAQGAWKVLKIQLPQTIRAQTRRLEQAMLTQRCWSITSTVNSWESLFLKHPLLRSLAITLLWGVIPAGQAHIQTLFRPLEDGTLTDATDAPVTLPAAGCVRLIHPIELDEQTLAAWTEHLSAYALVQPFAQLQRPIQRVSAEERDATSWEHCQGARVHGGAFKGRALKANWQRGLIDDHGRYDTISKRYPEAGLEARLACSGLPVGAAGNEWTCTLISLTFTAYKQRERVLPLGQVPRCC